MELQLSHAETLSVLANESLGLGDGILCLNDHDGNPGNMRVARRCYCCVLANKHFQHSLAALLCIIADRRLELCPIETLYDTANLPHVFSLISR
ncbi:hypothetical protein ABIE78_002779 [Sinorhizobium fredii]